MNVLGSYQDDGYAHLQGLLPPEVTLAFLQTLKLDMGSEPIPLSRVGTHPNLLKRAAFEAYGYNYKPMLGFLWGLTPIVSEPGRLFTMLAMLAPSSSVSTAADVSPTETVPASTTLSPFRSPNATDTGTGPAA